MRSDLFVVTFNRKSPPSWEPICPRCGGAANSRLSFLTQAKWGCIGIFVPILLLFGLARVTVPICAGCKRALRFQQLGRTAICLVCMVPVICAMIWLGIENKVVRRIVMIILTIIGLLPWVVLEVINPLDVSIECEGDECSFRFCSEAFSLAHGGKTYDILED